MIPESLPQSMQRILLMLPCTMKSSVGLTNSTNGMAIPSIAAIHNMSYGPNCLGWPTRQPNFRSTSRAK